MTDDPWVGFKSAVIDLELPSGPVRLRAGVGAGIATFPFGEPVHIITAWNPGGVVVGAAQNRVADRLLAERLGELDRETYRTCGHDGRFDHAEPGWLVEGLSRVEALAIGHRFGQLAVYEWDASALWILGTDRLARIEHHIWILEPLAEPALAIIRRWWAREMPLA